MAIIWRWNDRVWLLIVLSMASGCSGSSSKSVESSAVKRVVEQAIENQVFVEGGTFRLGDIGHPNGRPYVTLTDFSRPAVEISVDSYSISRYETTWGEMKVCYDDLGRAHLYADDFTLKEYIKSTDDPLSPNYRRKPARAPSYGEAEGFCDWLADKSGLPFAIPTEAQWEYAARSRGQNMPYATDTGEVEKDPYLRRPVGSYPPNPLGLHDMTGNVSEWTQDWFQEDFYEHAPTKNPSGPATPVDPNRPQKAVRDWAGRGDHMGGGGTVFARAGRDVDSSGHGFRCVVNSPKPLH